jgi:SP family general alpha glucoside:H+ symporter-like MFS transporter
MEKQDHEAAVDTRKLSTEKEISEDVAEAIAIEHTLTFWEAVKMYPKAIGWSMYFSLGVIMLCTFPAILSYAH